MPVLGAVVYVCFFGFGMGTRFAYFHMCGGCVVDKISFKRDREKCESKRAYRF